MKKELIYFDKTANPVLYKRASILMQEFVSSVAELNCVYNTGGKEESEQFVRDFVQAFSCSLSWEILGHDIFD